MKMKAAVLTVCGAPRPFAKSKPIQVVEVDLDPPGEGELLVKVGGGGLCHSDLSLINGDRPRPVPIVLGHEGAGEIVEVGSGVHDVKKGDHVCFTFNVSCGRCRRCLEGRPYICERSITPRAAGQLLSGNHRLHYDGKPVNHQSGVSCYAEYAVVDRGSIVVIDKSLPLDLAALFGCAVVTGVGAVVNTAQIQPGSSVAVVGLGGVGLSGLVGGNLQMSDRSTIISNGSTIVLPDYYNVSNFVTQTTSANLPTKRRVLGAYAQLIADYGDWAYLQLTGRNDWSSTLPTKDNSYFYPSAALSLIFTDALNWHPGWLDYGKLRLSHETVDVHEVIDSVLELFRSEIQVKQQDVHVDKAAHHHYVLGDRARLPLSVRRPAIRGYQPGRRHRY